MDTGLIEIKVTGKPEVMEWKKSELSSPGENELLIEHSAVGLNYIDTYHRSGLYPLDLPSGLGLEASGVVKEVGSSVKGFEVGDRVAYCTGPIGAYSERRLIPASKVIKLNESISSEMAAAILLKGMTVEYLLHRTFPVQSGQTILFHAVAGGVGLIACQWAKALGCTVIGTAGSQEKAEVARQKGCDHVILYRDESIFDRVMEITNGNGVPVVYDSVGNDTFDASLACLEKRGMLVSFGQSSGSIPDVNLAVFAPKSLFFSRPSLFNYCSTPEESQMSADRLFEMVQAGKVQVDIRQRYSLKDAVKAHTDLESRKLIGSTILVPENV